MLKKLSECQLKQAKLADGTIVQGVTYRTFAYGEMTMCTGMYYEKGAIVPLHKHHHEQVGYVVGGRIKLITNGTETILEKGDSYALPGNTEHSLEAIEESEIIDVFTPVRKEYL